MFQQFRWMIEDNLLCASWTDLTPYILSNKWSRLWSIFVCIPHINKQTMFSKQVHKQCQQTATKSVFAHPITTEKHRTKYTPEAEYITLINTHSTILKSTPKHTQTTQYRPQHELATNQRVPKRRIVQRWKFLNKKSSQSESSTFSTRNWDPIVCLEFYDVYARHEALIGKDHMTSLVETNKIAVFIK